MVTRRNVLTLGALSGLAACSRERAEARDGALEAPVMMDPGAIRIAFGSCNKPNLDQPLWGPIRRTAPTAFAWLGDIVYTKDGDVAALPSLYARQAANAGYRELRRASRVVGVWDDHDYGINDGGRGFPGRERARKALLDFLEEPPDSPRRERAGVYASYLFGDPSFRVKLLLLDTRSQRERAGAHADVLGEEQWRWLEAELRDGAARVHLLASSIQVLPAQHRYEKWSRYPASRARLLELIGGSGAPGCVLLSGDRHLAELSRIEHPALRYPVLELTSSGLTHSYSTVGSEPNDLRVGSLYPELNFGLVTLNPRVRRMQLEVRTRAGLLALAHSVPFSEMGVG